MGDVVQLDASRGLAAVRARTGTELRGIADQLFAHATRLAFDGVWAAWAAEQPIGAEVDVTESDLRGSGDAGVLSVIEARDAVLLAAHTVISSQRRGG